MSKFLHSHPTALEALILYDIEKWRTADRSHQSYCKIIGKNAISEEDFNKLYEKVIREKEAILENPPNLRLCILSDVIEKKSIEKLYEDICKMIESKDIDYQDFEFWFNRFSSGNWNLDQKTFSDLPMEIVEIIVENSDFSSQTNLREVSCGLENIVGRIDSSIDTYSCTRNSTYRWKTMFYSGKREDFNDRVFRQYSNERAFDSLECDLKNQRLRFEYFEFESYNYSNPQDNQELIDVLSSLNHPLEITELKMHSMTKNSMMALLKAAKPGTLKEIDVSAARRYKTVVNQFVKMDQWKQAKKVTVHGVLFDLSRHFRSFHNFEWFNVSAHSITVNDMLNMKKVFLENVNFKHCSIETKIIPPTNEIKEQLGLVDVSHGAGFYIGRCEIPSSNDYLEFRIKEKVRDYDTVVFSVYRKTIGNNRISRFAF